MNEARSNRFPVAGPWKNLALSLAVLAVMVGIVELTLRSLGVGDPRVPTFYRQPHPTFGWSLEPGAAYLNPLPEGTVSVRFNSAGWRDLERQSDRRWDRRRIVVLGDSFMEAYSVELQDSFTQRLESDLAQTAGQPEVWNLGVAGFGTLQEYLVFRDVARRLDPDLVLLGFTVANDLRNNSRELEAKLGEDKFKLRSRPFLVDCPDCDSPWTVSEIETAAIEQQYRRARAQRTRPWRWVYDRSSLLQAIRMTAASRLRRSRGDQEGGRHLALFGVHYCDEPPEYERAWQTTGKILERLRDEVRGGGAELVVFSVPTRRETNADHVAALRRRSPDAVRLCQEEAPGFDRLGETLAGLGIPYVDLLPDFRRGERELRLFRNSDGHWNSRGHALAARRLREGLEAKGILPLDIVGPPGEKPHEERSRGARPPGAVPENDEARASRRS